MPKATPEQLATLDALADDLAERGVAFERGQMFGCPGFRAVGKGKFFATLWGGDLVFKLAEPELSQALALPDAEQFAPMPGRPMKEWVRVPPTNADQWPALAHAAAAALPSV